MTGDFALRNWNDVVTNPQNDQDLIIQQAVAALSTCSNFRNLNPQQIYDHLIQSARQQYALSGGQTGGQTVGAGQRTGSARG